jgi:cobalt-zinc-cadmium efflux system membrane fusion protein
MKKINNISTQAHKASKRVWPVALICISLLILVLPCSVAMAEEEAHEEGHNKTEVEIQAATRELVPIITQELQRQPLAITISAPGEVRFNEYKSADISPLIDSNVVERLARMGDEVEALQPLVTLVSVDVAQAQGNFDVANREWQRVESLGKNTVGSKRFTEVRVAYEQARIRLATYGLTEQAIDEIKSGKNTLALGQFQLKAPIAGTVLSDSFKLGQRIPAGQTLFLISDESSIWVEAHLAPGSASGIEKGMPARVRLTDQWHDGVVIQRHHLLEEETRTIPVRIEVQLPEGEDHHRGEFGQVEIVTSYTSPVLAVPESALAQNDEGQWVVFVEDEPDHFIRTPVTRGQIYAGLVAIDGIEPGSTVVTNGAFYLAAELAKSGFGGDDH